MNCTGRAVTEMNLYMSKLQECFFLDNCIYRLLNTEVGITHELPRNLSPNYYATIFNRLFRLELSPESFVQLSNIKCLIWL